MTLIRRLSTSLCDWCVLLTFTQHVVKVQHALRAVTKMSAL